MVAKIADEVSAELVEFVGREAGLTGKFGGGLLARRNEDKLAQDAETGVAATAAQVGVETGIAGLEVVAHLVGEGDEIEFLATEGLVGDGSGVLVIIIERTGGIGNLGTGEQEAVGGTDVFVKFAEWKLDAFEEGAGEEFAGDRHGEAVLGEHGF